MIRSWPSGQPDKETAAQVDIEEVTVSDKVDVNALMAMYICGMRVCLNMVAPVFKYSNIWVLRDMAIEESWLR